jgi:hypothetical protein
MHHLYCCPLPQIASYGLGVYALEKARRPCYPAGLGGQRSGELELELLLGMLHAVYDDCFGSREVRVGMSLRTLRSLVEGRMNSCGFRD